MKRFFMLGLLAVLAACSLGPQTTGEYTVIPVFYGTDRAVATPADASAYFTARRAPMSYGRADISIPASHRQGDIERPQGMWGFEMKEDPKTHVVVTRLLRMDKDAFLTSIGNEATGKHLLVFIHGYNFSFDMALRRAAQLKYDLDYPGPALLFSWPSMGAVGGYPRDVTNAAWAAADLENFLSDVAAKAGASQVDIIAHSMGNQPLLEALRHLAARKTPVHFREIIMAAPDIDADIFRRVAPEIKGSAARVTLYASSGDEALKASRKFNGYARAGNAGEGIVAVEGIDTVDASGLDTNIMGHTYYGDSQPVLGDIHALLMTDAAPETRQGVHQMRRDGQSYWRLSR